MNNNPLPEMSEDQLAEIKRRMDDFDSRVRYYIISYILRDELFFCIESDCWTSDRKTATAFKRKKYAEAINQLLGNKTHHLIKEYEIE